MTITDCKPCSRDGTPHSLAAFTLVDLLTVIAIIGVVASVALPAVQAARRTADRTERLHWKRHRHLDTSPERSAPFHILFIGNSHTDFGDIPGVVREMSRVGRRTPVVTSSLIIYGETMEGQWKRGIANEVIERSVDDSFDFVVLQDVGTLPCVNRESFFDYGTRFAEASIRAGAIPLQYLPFSRAEDCMSGHCPQDKITEAAIDVHRAAGGEKGLAEISPVGEAWRSVRAARPRIPLLRDDGVHANEIGAYLTACVFYSVIHRRSPIGLPGTITTPKTTLRVAPEIATVLQTHAWNTCESWRRRTKTWFTK